MYEVNTVAFPFFSAFIPADVEPTYQRAFCKTSERKPKVRQWQRIGYVNLACLIILTACGDGSGTQPSVNQSSSSSTTAATNSIVGVSSDSDTPSSVSQLSSTSTSTSTIAVPDSTTGMYTGSAAVLDVDKLASPLQVAAVRRMTGASTDPVNDVVSADSALYSAVAWGQVPKNGFFFLNNNFGKGNFVNGVDYTSTLTAQAATFPANAVMKWNWPDATSGSAFAYAYPEIIYGGGPWGNPYRSVGPWPQKVKDNIRLIANYDITLGGNVNSYNVLLDIYLTASPLSVDGSHTAEISFFPHLNDPGNLTNVTMFSFGPASITRQGKQILVRPVNALHTPADLLVGSINIKEILNYLVSINWITGEEYLRGAEFGVEVQVPNYYNSTPHQGSMTVNSLSYNWK